MGTRDQFVISPLKLYHARLTYNDRDSAPDILKAYHAEEGTRQSILEAWEEDGRPSQKKKKKRGRVSEGVNVSGSAKKAKKNGHPRNSTPPASAKVKDFEPPQGSWEEEVVEIDAQQGEEGSVLVYLTWRGGQKTSHPLPQVYKRCPQKVRDISDIKVKLANIQTRCWDSTSVTC